MAHTICLCFVEKALWRTFCSAGGHQRSARNTVIANNLLILQSYPHQTIPDPHLMGRGYCIISIWIILRRVSPKFAGSLNVRVFYSIYTVCIHYTCSQYNIYIYTIYTIYLFIYAPPYLFPFQIPSFLLCFHGCHSNHLHRASQESQVTPDPPARPKRDRAPHSWWRHRPWYMTWIQQGHSWMWLAQSKCT